jgi:hypothetical protein
MKTARMCKMETLTRPKVLTPDRSESLTLLKVVPQTANAPSQRLLGFVADTMRNAPRSPSRIRAGRRGSRESRRVGSFSLAGSFTKHGPFSTTVQNRDFSRMCLPFRTLNRTKEPDDLLRRTNDARPELSPTTPTSDPSQWFVSLPRLLGHCQ